MLSLLVGFGLFLVVFPNAVEEFDTRGRKLEVLDSHVDALGDNAAADLLVDDHSDGPGIHVEDCAGAAVVVLVRHTLVDGSVDNNVHNISGLVGGEGIRDVDGSVLLEAFSELVAGLALIAVAVGHLIILK